MKRTLLLLTFGWSFIGLSQTCFDTGTGVDGAYSATTNSTLPGGTYNFTSFTIDPGVVVSVTGTAPLEIYCQGAMNINGTLSVNGGNGTDGIVSVGAGVGGLGVAGGGNGGDGNYSTSTGQLPGNDGTNTGGTGTAGMGWSGGGGAGYATAGQASGGATGGFAGAAYGTTDLMILTSGSGGGGGSGGFSCGSGGGGAGGGIIILHAPSIYIAAGGLITANGGDGGSDGTGNCGGGGAGSGGTIWIETTALSNNGSISAIGGLGGASAIPGAPYYGVGGNGSDGRIRLDGTASGSGTTNPPVGYFGTAPGIPLTNQAFTICYAETVTVGSNTYSATGMYTDTIVTAGGCDSIVETDLTVLPFNETTQSFTICEGDVVMVGMSSYATAGTYTDVLTGVNTCDSTVVTTINVDTIDATVDNTVNVLTANSSVGTYQWLDCDNNNAPISGATNQVFSPTAIGNYAVEIIVGNCMDTSDCILVDFAGLDEYKTSFISIFPNPSNGVVHLNGLENISGFQSLEIYTATGQKVAEYTELETSYDLSKLNAGVYFMEFLLKESKETIRLIKQ